MRQLAEQMLGRLGQESFMRDAPTHGTKSADRHRERPTSFPLVRLVPLVLLTEIAALEITLIYPALQAMQSEFRTPSIGWTLTVTSLTGVVAQPMLGKVADVIGKRRMILCASVAFMLGSLVCALAPTFPVLLAGRVLQGISMVVAPAAYGLIRDVLPARVVPVAMGAITTGLGLSALAGPLTGAVLLDAFGFRAVFWFCLVYAAVLAPVVLMAFPESAVRLRRKIDVLGGLLLGAGIGALLLAVGQGRAWGWFSPATLGCVLLGAVLLVLFVRVELRAAEPLVDLRLLTGPALRWTLLAAFGCAFAIGGYGYLAPLLVQTPVAAGYGLGLGAMGVALILVPQGVLASVCGPVGGLLARRRSPRTTLLIAASALAASMVWLTVLHTAVWQFLLAAVLQGIGFGFFFVSAANLVIEAVPPTHTAVSAGMMGVANNLGNATGVTVFGAVLAAHLVSRAQDGTPARYAESGFVIALLTAACTTGAAVLIAALMRHGRGPASGGARIAAR
jgi:MFS family permease